MIQVAEVIEAKPLEYPDHLDTFDDIDYLDTVLQGCASSEWRNCSRSTG